MLQAIRARTVEQQFNNSFQPNSAVNIFPNNQGFWRFDKQIRRKGQYFYS